jgi:hypothetical protein
MTEDITADEPAADDVLNGIMLRLNDAWRQLPVEAIEAARRHRGAIIPRLIEAIRSATAAAAANREVTSQAHFFALFLLTEFRVKEALPAILEAVTLPGESPFDLFGDAITETLSRVLATLAADQPEVIDQLIRNPRLNEFVRGAAAGSYQYLVRDGYLSREEAIERLREHLRLGIESHDLELVTAIVPMLLPFGPAEARAEIMQAFDRGLIEEFTIDRESAEQEIAAGENQWQRELARLGPTAIHDAIKELQGWFAFNDDPNEGDEDDDSIPEPHVQRDLTPPATFSPLAPIVRSEPRVGRNDPCPCGSGRKFKKCCGQH